MGFRGDAMMDARAARIQESQSKNSTKQNWHSGEGGT